LAQSGADARPARLLVSDLPGRLRPSLCVWLWVYARDDRPWSGPDPPAAVYLYSPDRRAERPASHLARFKGVVQVDGYPGFERLPAGGDIQLAACWAHARRKFYEVHQATGSPVAAEALRRIAELYAIEVTIQDQTAATRHGVRRIKLLPWSRP
jgi:transposase